eukprot:gene19222-938_t
MVTDGDKADGRQMVTRQIVTNGDRWCTPDGWLRRWCKMVYPDRWCKMVYPDGWLRRWCKMAKRVERRKVLRMNADDELELCDYNEDEWEDGKTAPKMVVNPHSNVKAHVMTKSGILNLNKDDVP